MENNVYSVKNSKTKGKRGLKMIELFSFWITFHFIIYLIFKDYLPSWTNPMFWLVFGFSAQIALLILGRNVMPNWFKFGVFLWKLGILLLGLELFKYDMSIAAINFNLLVYLLYLGVLYFGYNKTVMDIYVGTILTANYHNLTPIKFIKNRFKNLV